MSKVAVIYWSGTGNTEAMAKAVAEGVQAAGAEADLFAVHEITAADAAKYDRLALGCPSMGDEVLEENDFEPFFESIESKLSGKKIALFGSYGWGDGQWMRDWEKRVDGDRAVLFGDGLIACGYPDENECIEFGKQFVAF